MPNKSATYAPIFVNRMFTGLWTQRNPLREAAVSYLHESYGGARNDSLLDGENVELGNHLTLTRAPGSSIYNSQVFPPIQSFCSFHTSTTGDEIVQVIADSITAVYDATGPNTKEAILTKAPGSGASYFQAVGPTLYISDGVETKKYRRAMSPTSGALPNTGIQYPTSAPNNQPLAYVGAPCRYWSPNTSMQAGYTVLDTNGNIQLMTGNSQQATTTTTTISPTASTQGSIPTGLPVTVYGTPEQTFGFSAHSHFSDHAWEITDAALAVDGDPSTSASATFSHVDGWCVGTWSFAYSGQTPINLTLNVLSGANAPIMSGSPMKAGVWYSVDGGTTWTEIWSQSTPVVRPRQWDAVTIPANTTVSNIIVCAYVQAHDDAGLQVNEINLVIGTTTISAPTTTNLTTGTATPRWNTALYSLTVDGQAIWQNEGPIGGWQPTTTYSATSTTGAIVDGNGNLQVVETAGTTGSTDPGIGSLGLTQVTVSGGDAVYSYSSSTGLAPTVGVQATFSGFSTAGNNLTAIITAVGSGSVTVAKTAQVNETHSGKAQLGWAAVAGQTTQDGTVVWLCCGPGQVAAFSGWQHAYSYHCQDGHVSTASSRTLNTGPVLGNTVIPLAGQGSTDTQCDQIWIWRTPDGGALLLLDDQYGASTMSIDGVRVVAAGTLTLTSVAVSGGDAVYAYSASTGDVPTVGQTVEISGFATAGNNVDGLITAVDPGVSITLATTTEVNETHAASAQLNDTSATYSYVLVGESARPHIGQTATVTGLDYTGNNGAFVVTAVDWLNQTFTVDNAAAIGAGSQTGSAVTPAPGSGIWTLKDTAADTDLNEFIIAPTDHANDPPPSGLIAMSYHNGRIFGAVGNVVYYSGGPDTLTGDGSQAFPPNNYFLFPSLVRRLVPYVTGMLVFTLSDIYLIQGAGTQGSPFYAVPYILGFGLESYWELSINGAIIYFKSSDGQVLSLNPSAGMEQVGFPIGDKFKVGGGFR